MAKIFGISDLPVSTIDKALKGYHFEPIKRVPLKPLKNTLSVDKFECINKTKKTSINAKIKHYINRRFSKDRLD